MPHSPCLTASEIATRIRDEAKETMDAPDSIPDLLEEFIDQLGYLEVAVSQLPDSEKLLFSDALGTALSRHAAKCRARNLAFLTLTYAYLAHMRLRLVGSQSPEAYDRGFAAFCSLFRTFPEVR